MRNADDFRAEVFRRAEEQRRAIRIRRARTAGAAVTVGCALVCLLTLNPWAQNAQPLPVESDSHAESGTPAATEPSEELATESGKKQSESTAATTTTATVTSAPGGTDMPCITTEVTSTTGGTTCKGTGETQSARSTQTTGAEPASTTHTVSPQEAMRCFCGKVIEIGTGSVLVEPLESFGEQRAAGDRIRCETVGAPPLEFTVGDILLIVYDGEIREVYPPELTVSNWKIASPGEAWN